MECCTHSFLPGPPAPGFPILVDSTDLGVIPDHLPCPTGPRRIHSASVPSPASPSQMIRTALPSFCPFTCSWSQRPSRSPSLPATSNLISPPLPCTLPVKVLEVGAGRKPGGHSSCGLYSERCLRGSGGLGVPGCPFPGSGCGPNLNLPSP